jgi:predicted Zn finger-like uncharacterized protein
MAAAKLVTRCPACRTAFRLVADQLRLRQGLVRCGQCDTVFDAREHLIELPSPAPPSGVGIPAEAATSRAAPPPGETARKAPHREPPGPPHGNSHEQTHERADEGVHETAHDQASEPGEDRPHIPPFDPGYDPGYDVPALDAPTVMLYQTQAEADEAAHAVTPRTEPESGATGAPGAGEEAASAVFVPGIVDHEKADATEAAEAPDIAEATGASDATHTANAAGMAGPAAEVQRKADVPEASDAPAAVPETAPWPRLDPRTLDDGLPPVAAGDDDATHTADTADVADTADTVQATAAQNEIATATRAKAAPAGVPSASGYLRAEAHDDFPEIPATGTSDTREQASRLWERRGEPAAPVFAPDFLRHAREPGPAPAQRKRVLQRLAIVLLVMAGLLQGTYLARSQLSGYFPVLRPAFEAMCAPLRCEVAPWRDIDALRIESSQLQKQDEDSDVYLLALTLRNQGRATVALPAIELVMTDLQDQLLLRKVLQPADYLEAGQQAFARHGLRAGTELPVRVRFRSQQAAANYRVLIFYP